MKLNVLIPLFSVIAIGLLSGCKCYPCLADGESLDLPYRSDQTINFINDSRETLSLLVQVTGNIPPSEYCGQFGSGFHGDCWGESNASLKYNKDSSALIIINYRPSDNNDVELYVTKIIMVLNATMAIKQGKVSTIDENGTVTVVNTMNINGNNYSNVYVYQNELAKINECSYFVYSTKDGVLKYSVKRDTSIESWTLAE